VSAAADRTGTPRCTSDIPGCAPERLCSSDTPSRLVIGTVRTLPHSSNIRVASSRSGEARQHSLERRDLMRRSRQAHSSGHFSVRCRSHVGLTYHPPLPRAYRRMDNDVALGNRAGPGGSRWKTVSLPAAGPGRRRLGENGVAPGRDDSIGAGTWRTSCRVACPARATGLHLPTVARVERVGPRPAVPSAQDRRLHLAWVARSPFDPPLRVAFSRLPALQSACRPCAGATGDAVRRHTGTSKRSRQAIRCRIVTWVDGCCRRCGRSPIACLLSTSANAPRRERTHVRGASGRPDVAA